MSLIQYSTLLYEKNFWLRPVCPVAQRIGSFWIFPCQKNADLVAITTNGGIRDPDADKMEYYLNIG